MTREEALSFLYKKMRSYSGKIETNRELVDLIEVDELINQIYDNLKSRICKNCKYYNPAYKVCENKKNIQPFEIDNEYVNMFTDDDFSCNRFERKKQCQQN